MAPKFDFIIVGGGTAGCLLAYRLANAPSRPSVLIAEAGVHPEGDYLRAPYHRYSPAFLRPDLEYGYTSVPQKELNGRTIGYNRGKGLGGSTIMNFQVYLYGSKEDYNRWADIVGDESWKWEHTKKSFQSIENYDFAGAKEYSHLANPDPAEHGKDGKVQVCLPPTLERGTVEDLESVINGGDNVNLDFNSGNPVGVGLFPTSSSKDGRTTSATAHLVDTPDNLTIWTGAAVHRLLFEGTKVVGVETMDGRQALSNKEVIVSGGTLDTPKLLLLNGIGPAKELEALQIPVVKDLAGVGKGLRDHILAIFSCEVDGSHNDKHAFESNPDMVREAEALWKSSKSGNFALYNSTLWGGFLKMPGLEDFPEFKALPKDVQEFLSRPAVPTYEFGANGGALPGIVVSEGSAYLNVYAFLMNPQSEGSVTLKSSNPEEKPVIDLAFLEHPYDKRVMREAIRLTWQKTYENPYLKKLVKKRLLGPESLSDEHIDGYMKEAVSTVWHANGTAVMGKKDNPRAVVDSDFKVYGIEGLRVADLSVCPLTPNNHTQSTAYLVGQKAAEKLIAQYKL